MAASTLSLVGGRTFGWLFRTRDTVWWETPASRATSAMTGGRPRLPGPLTTDAIGRLSALSPGDRTTSGLLAARCAASGQLGPALALTSVPIKWRCEAYTPDSDRHLCSVRPDFLRLRAAVAPLPRYPPAAGPTRPAPVRLLTSARIADVRTCRDWPRRPAGRGTRPGPCARPRCPAGPAAPPAPCAR